MEKIRVTRKNGMFVFLLVSAFIISLLNFSSSVLASGESGSVTFNAAHAPLYYPPSINNPNFQCIDRTCSWMDSNGLYPVQILTSSNFVSGDKLKITSVSGSICHRVHKPCSGDCKTCCCRNLPGICMDTNYKDDNRVYSDNPNILVGFYKSNVASKVNIPIQEIPLSSFIDKEVTIPEGTKYIFIYYKENKGNYADNNIAFKMTLNYEVLEVKCYKNSDCDDSNSNTEDKCINPGKSNSYCVNKEIECFKNGDCGVDGYVGGNFCKNNDVYRVFQEFKCNKPGLGNSYCTNILYDKFVKSCGDGMVCDGGECVKDDDLEAPVIELISPVNGNEVMSPVEFNYKVSDESDLAYCKLFINSNEVLKDNNVVKGVNYFDYELDEGNYFWYVVCGDVENNIGVSKTGSFEVVKPICCNDGDCGVNDFIPNTEVCKDNNVFANFISYVCKNPGKINAYCSSSTILKLKEDCGDSYCEEPSLPYCFGDSVYVKQKCYDKGCSCGDCFSDVYYKEKKIKDCEFGCLDGACRDYVDLEGPLVNLLVPENGSVVSGKVWFNYTASDESGVRNCSLLIDGEVVLSSGDVSDSVNTFEKGFWESEKNYTAQIVCYDNYDNLGLSEEVSFFYSGEYCECDSDCDGGSIEKLVCDGDDVVKKIIKSVCVDNVCESKTIFEFVRTCARGCLNGRCRSLPGGGAVLVNDSILTVSVSDSDFLVDEDYLRFMSDRINLFSSDDLYNISDLAVLDGYDNDRIVLSDDNDVFRFNLWIMVIIFLIIAIILLIFLIILFVVK
jgi:hypothetical protein